MTGEMNDGLVVWEEFHVATSLSSLPSTWSQSTSGKSRHPCVACLPAFPPALADTIRGRHCSDKLISASTQRRSTIFSMAGTDYSLLLAIINNQCRSLSITPSGAHCKAHL